jgi:hypothetical protein
MKKPAPNLNMQGDSKIMRGKKAKRLRRLAGTLCRQEGIKLGEGYNTYNQAMNRIDWVPQLDDKGYPMMDPEGVPMMKTDQCPGTVTCAWKVRVMYKGLKRLSHDNPEL